MPATQAATRTGAGAAAGQQQDVEVVVKVFLPNNLKVALRVRESVTSAELCEKAIAEWHDKVGEETVVLNENSVYALFMVSFDQHDRFLFDQERPIRLKQEILQQNSNGQSSRAEPVRFMLKDTLRGQRQIKLFDDDGGYKSYSLTTETTSQEVAL